MLKYYLGIGYFYSDEGQKARSIFEEVKYDLVDTELINDCWEYLEELGES